MYIIPHHSFKNKCRGLARNKYCTRGSSVLYKFKRENSTIQLEEFTKKVLFMFCVL